MAEGKLMVKTSFAEVPVPLEEGGYSCVSAPKVQRMKKSWRGSRLAEKVESQAKF